ncbi:NAD(P)-binding domain-containing protein [Streptosporangium lutulentum]
MTFDHPAVTVIGLGSMGSALATALLDRGHPTTVWNRTAHRAEALAARGARPAADPGEAVTASPLIVACVLDYEALHGVLEPVGGSLEGRTLVNLTSGSPEQARETAAWALLVRRRLSRRRRHDDSPGCRQTGDDVPLQRFTRSLRRPPPHPGRVGRPLHLGADPGLASSTTPRCSA